MSGHSKWATIKHKKAATDAKKGKIFSRYSKEITIAAKAGGKDLDMNPRLRTAIAAAKGVNMPNDNIDRAVKKGAGELAGQAAFEEMTLEGYAPGGVAILIHCLSDNRNRTTSNIRNVLTKHNGSLASSNAVAWQFHRKCRFVVEGPEVTEDKLLELLLNAGADVENVNVDEPGVAEIIGAPDAFGDIAKTLEGAKIKVSESSIVMVPETMIEVKEESLARQATRLVDLLEEDDDVQALYNNLSMSDELMAKLAAE